MVCKEQNIYVGATYKDPIQVPKHKNMPIDFVSASTIKDSGDRTEFASGAVRDMREGKGRCDLMPLQVIREYLSNAAVGYISNFMQDYDTAELHNCLMVFADEAYNGCPHTMFLEVAKHFEES